MQAIQKIYIILSENQLKKSLEHLQDLVSGIYEDFIIKVSSNRKIETDVLKNEIGALIFSSNKAKNFF